MGGDTADQRDGGGRLLGQDVRVEGGGHGPDDTEPAAPTIVSMRNGSDRGGQALRVLLTGAAGFIGSQVLTALEGRGHEVVGVDLLLASAHGPSPTPPQGVLTLDVRDGDAMERTLRGIDVVCHQAAVVGAGVDADDAPAFASHNDFGTAVLLAAMHRAGCRRLVLASSMVVYGDGRYRCEAHGTGGAAAPQARSTSRRGSSTAGARSAGSP